MAKKKVYDNPIDKNIPWDGNEETGNLPVKGARVEEFLKKTLNSKMGLMDYDEANNHYLVFADEQSRDAYNEDPTKTELILGKFDAPFNYTAEIKMLTPMYNAVFYGSTGNYIQFTYDIKNKNGASTGESANVVITCIWNGTKKEYRQIAHFGDVVTFQVDDKIKEGTNTIIVGITGQTSLAATTMAVTYQSVNLQLSDELDISKVYDLSSGEQIVTIPFSASGYGLKVVEWYIDGVLQDFAKDVDEIVETSTTRTKNITLSNLNQGRHSLQIRAYTTVNGEKFYTNTLYRDLLVYTGADKETIVGVALDIPKEHGIIEGNSNPIIYGMVQYVPYTLRFATYSPTNVKDLNVQLSLGEDIVGEYVTNNNIQNACIITPKKSGNQVVSINVGEVSYNITSVVQNTTIAIREITDALMLNFNCEGKSNNSANKDSWSYGDYEATFEGFDWNETSGWNNGRLVINKGNSFSINFAPLMGKPTQNGRTIEFEFSTFNVEDDNAIICDLRNDSGYGILITATKAKLISEAGAVIETDFKSDENVRISFVINRSSGSTNKQLSFIYTNGVNSRCVNWDVNDSYASNTTIKFEGSEGACVRLKSILVYDNALTDNQMLNNFELYRDTLEEMLEVYNRNDVYMAGSETFSPDKMAARLPYMLITGEIPKLEGTSNRDEQITVDVEYKNLQDPTRSFTMKGAALRPQGTSSMGYPKKNYRLYSRKFDTTVMYDYLGNKVVDRLYSFTEGAQPVDCWCFKADYAESSGTHNTAIARLWGNAYKNALVTTNSLEEGNEHHVVEKNVLRTNAQQIAIDSGYPYDVRTTIDGFPFLLFYRLTVNHEPIFIGKYNFNNDKSTESVFGFTGIEGFDNSRMQCWELLNNGNALGLFQSVANFDTEWKEAFEARYPDKSTNVTDLKTFCTWMSGVTKEDFTTQKWQHMDVFKLAGYYCYLLRHAAADQFVKNSMLTSEDGEHFYFILYDNDTINGLTNDSRLVIPFDADRNTLGSDGQYLFAGHDSRLWNMLEDDEEFMKIVRDVDNALYSAGISYKNVIKEFDTEQADKWVERVYNQDAQYKYVGPFRNSGTNNLHMLQGKRDLHRRYWLAKRYAIYDSKFLTGSFKANIIEIKCINNTSSGQEITIVAGENLEYGYGINNIIRASNVALSKDEQHTFTVEQVLNIGDPLAIYGAPYIKSVDLSKMTDRLNLVDIDGVYDDTLGTKLEELIVGNEDKTNNQVTEISGLKMAKKLKTLDVQGMKGITSLDLSEQKNLNYLWAFGSGIANITFAKGAPILALELPATLTTFSVEQLPKLSTSDTTFEDISVLKGMIVKNCPQLSNDFSFVKNWYDAKTTDNSSCTLIMDNVDWDDVTAEEFLSLCQIKISGGQFELSGKISIPSLTLEQATTLVELFGDKVFSPTSKLYINTGAATFITGATSLLEGESEQYTVLNIGGEDTVSVEWSIVNFSSPYVTINEKGLLTTKEGLRAQTFGIQAIATTTSGKKVYVRTSVTTIARTYPSSSNITLNGPNQPENGDIYTVNIAQEYNGTITVAWSVTGDAANYIEITPADDGLSATLAVTQVENMVTGTIQAVVKKAFDNSSIATKSISVSIVNENIAETDPTVCQAFFEKRLTSNASYITKDEAASINDAAFANVNLRKTTTFQFNGFRHFTGITLIPDNFFSSSYITSLNIPKNVKTIGIRAFSSCSKLQTLDIPEGVTNIKSYAFQYSYVKSISFPQSLLNIGEGAFDNAYSLETVNFTDGALVDIGKKAFNDCTKLTTLNTTGIKSIGEESFSGCTKLTTLELSGLTSLEKNAFKNCTSLTSVFIPNTLISIGVSPFSECAALTSIVVDTNNSTYDSRNNCNAIIRTQTNTLIQGCNSTIIPDNIQGFGTAAFNGMKGLSEVIIPYGMSYIPSKVFRSTGISSINIPDSVTRIEDEALNYTNIKELIIPDTVTRVYDLYGLRKLEKLHIGANCEFIKSSISGSYYVRIASDADKLDSITVSPDNKYYYSDNCNAVISKSSNILMLGCSNTVIPENVVSIQEEAFKGTNIKSITIPNSVQSIGNSAFRGCSSLESVVIEGSITILSEYIFNNCPALKDITLPNSIITIEKYVFSNCTSLEVINLPEGLQYISNDCFSECTSLESITLPSTLLGLGYGTFSDCINLKAITCYAPSSPKSYSDSWGSSKHSTGNRYTGLNTKNTEGNILYVPSGATGYDTSYWLDPLQNASKCGFTLSATL